MSGATTKRLFTRQPIVCWSHTKLVITSTPKFVRILQRSLRNLRATSHSLALAPPPHCIPGALHTTITPLLLALQPTTQQHWLCSSPSSSRTLSSGAVREIRTTLTQDRPVRVRGRLDGKEATSGDLAISPPSSGIPATLVVCHACSRYRRGALPVPIGPRAIKPSSGASNTQMTFEQAPHLT